MSQQVFDIAYEKRSYRNPTENNLWSFLLVKIYKNIISRIQGFGNNFSAGSLKDHDGVLQEFLKQFNRNSANPAGT